MQSSKCKELVPAPVVAREFNVNRRTIGRWIKDGASGFPQPVEVNNRLYFDRGELEAWKAEQLRFRTTACSYKPAKSEAA